MAEARVLARAARAAQGPLAELSQAQIDAAVTAMAEAVGPHAETLARLAVEETGFGVVADKVRKNTFASGRVFEFILPMKTVGVINRIEAKKIIEIAEPFGVVAAIVPSTNPTSTAIYKVLIAIKARCPIVISPHPSAARCITRTVEVMAEAGARAGLPAGSIGWMRTITLEGTQELMRQREVAVILATGGMGLVRSAYSAGKPAYGVGPGNAPCYVDRTADVAKAAHDIVLGKSFDNGLLCSSPNSVVVDESVSEEARRQFQAQGAHFLNSAEVDRLASALVTPQRLPNPALVGRSAAAIAKAVGIAVPAGVRVLVAPLAGVGRDFPLSIEKLCPVLSWYVVKDWREGCERCIQILRYGGMGHTMSIHSQDDDVILQFGLRKPAFRICVNTPTTHGSIGLTTGLDPAMTLGCGGWGGNITSDNISPRHLLNIKRVAYELRPAVATAPSPGAPPTRGASPVYGSRPPLPAVPAKHVPGGIPAEDLSERIDRFLMARGFAGREEQATAGASAPAIRSAGHGAGHDAGHDAGHEVGSEATSVAVSVAASDLGRRPSGAGSPTDEPVLFVCEDDVRQALRFGRKIVVGDRTIVTPSARDLGEQEKILIQAGWPR